MEVKLPGSSRIDVADVLRGFAVMGIIVLHSVEHYNFYSYPETTASWMQFTDKVIWEAMFFTFGGKAYAIFALLFGFSFFIQDNRQLQQGRDFRGRFAWRLVLLFLFGNINAAFFTGEILVLYSIIGFVLIGVCRLSTRVVLGLAIICMLQPLAWWEFFSALVHPGQEIGQNLSNYYFGIAFEAQQGTSFWEMLKVNLWEGQLASLTWAWEHGRMFQTAALFMLGMLIGRTGLFLYTEQNLKFWFKALLIGIIAFFPLNGLGNLLPQFVESQAALVPLKLIIQSLANLGFMVFMVSGIILLFYTTALKKWMSKIIPYGRMSLTDYITQSIVGSCLFYGWGIALHRYLGITWSFGVGILLFGLQYCFACWWMKTHKQGPFEGWWKKATWIGYKN